MEVSGQLHAMVTLLPGEEPLPSTYWIGGWVGLRSDLDNMEKRKISCPCRESNLSRQHVAIPTDLSRFHIVKIIAIISILCGHNTEDFLSRWHIQQPLYFEGLR
jgi:hypothetical protein